MRLGRGLRENRNIEEELLFSTTYNFELMQIWFYKKNVLADIHVLKKTNHPFILHAVMTAEEMIYDLNKLLETLKLFDHKEVIVHPVLEKNRHKDSLKNLKRAVENSANVLKEHQIELFLENNSMVTDINHRLDDMKYLYEHPDVHLLLDVAHISSYEHLEGILAIEHPKKLHVADKHFHVPHEHLPIGQGELDFKKLFDTYLPSFQGDIIMELDGNDQTLIQSRDRLKFFLNKK